MGVLCVFDCYACKYKAKVMRVSVKRFSYRQGLHVYYTCTCTCICIFRRRFDFLIPSRMDRGLELFMSVHRDMSVSKIWEPPKVYISHTLPDASRLMELCKRHQGQVVSNETEATHIVLPGQRQEWRESKFNVDIQRCTCIHYMYKIVIS